MGWLEYVAVAFGVISVYLSTREHVVAWPTALVNTALYSAIFWRTGLYASVLLQAVFFSLSVYGWWAWLYGGAQHTPLVVERITRRQVLALVPIALVSWVSLGLFLSTVDGARLPWLDSALTAISLVAQWLMTRKVLENWILWNVVNVAYVALYFSQGLKPTAGLYVVYIVLAALGFFSWRASLRRRLAATG